MSVVKVIEIHAQSDKSWEDATAKALAAAARTVRNIRSLYVSEFQAMVENNAITAYRVNCKISFVIEGT